MTKIAVVLTLAVALSCLTISTVQADPLTGGQAVKYMNNSLKAAALPVWKITQDGTVDSVPWVDHTPNPRFSIYDTNGDNTTDPSTWVDDVVLDKETGLVWERSPDSFTNNWYYLVYLAYNKCLGGRKGWRLPTIEELNSLVDPNEPPPTLISGHPFVNVGTGFYWSSTTDAEYITTFNAWGVVFSSGNAGKQVKDYSFPAWFVRGGNGYASGDWHSTP